MSEAAPARKMRIHLLVPAQNGPIQSGVGGNNPLMPVGTNARYVCACDPGITMNVMDRGTTEPWGVRCNACRETALFNAVNRPKPGMVGPVGDLEADGCCG